MLITQVKTDEAVGAAKRTAPSLSRVCRRFLI